MNTFTFKAAREDGKVVTGQIKAAHQNEAIRVLNLRKLQPIFIKKKQSILKLGSGSIVAQRDLVVFSRQLAFLVESGVPIIQSLQIVQPITQSAVLKNILSQLIKSVDKGKNLSEALAEHPAVFNNLFFSLVQAGESSGKLNVLLAQLADDIESSDRLRSKVTKALMYPMFVLSVGVAIVIGLMVFVVPKFASVFESAGSELPAMTKVLMSISDFFVNNLLLVLFTLVAAPIAFFMYLFSPAGRKFKDQLFWVLPIMGPIVRKNSLARFTKTLSYLLASGVNVTEALNNASTASNNYLVESAIQTAIARVESGQSIAQSISKEKIFPHLLSQMISIGEETGKLDATLKKVSEFYEEQVKASASAIADMIQPIFIVVLGGFVAFVVIAMYLPIFKLAGAAGGF